MINEAEHVGLPFLSAYLDSIGTSYRYGANFAASSSTITRQNESWFLNGVSPFPLEIQVEHYTQFKERTAYLYNQGPQLSNQLAVINIIFYLKKVKLFFKNVL